MAPRRRSWENRSLPDNLYPMRRSDGRIYYQYKRPDTGQFVGFGYDKAKVVDAAKQLNQLLGKGRDLISKVLDTGDESFGEFLRGFRDTIQPARRIKGKPLSNETVKEHHRLLRHFDEEWGHKTFRSISQADPRELSQPTEYVRGIQQASGSTFDHLEARGF